MGIGMACPFWGLVPIILSWIFGGIVLVCGLSKNSYFPNNLNWATITGICLLGIATVAFFIGDKIIVQKINKSKFGKEKPLSKDICNCCGHFYAVHKYGSCPYKD